MYDDIFGDLTVDFDFDPGYRSSCTKYVCDTPLMNEGGDECQLPQISFTYWCCYRVRLVKMLFSSK